MLMKFHLRIIFHQNLSVNWCVLRYLNGCARADMDRLFLTPQIRFSAYLRVAIAKLAYSLQPTAPSMAE